MRVAQPDIAKILKKLRKERALSLSKAAELTGVSKAMLGQIELGQSSPTVATLWKIATGFNVAFSVFLEDHIVKPEQFSFKDYLTFSEEKELRMKIIPLIPFDKQLRMDLFQIELIPGTFSRSTPHEKGVIEHIIVFEGTLQLTLEDKKFSINKGESFRFEADVEHSYANESDSSVILHNLIHYPKMN